MWTKGKTVKRNTVSKNTRVDVDGHLVLMFM